jgi:hypothetical protein
VLIAIVLTASSGMIDYALQRRGEADELLQAGDRLEQLPANFGNWRMTHEEPLHGSTARELQCPGYVNRSYVHLASGEKVNVAVLVGPAGAVSVHTPEICYSSREYELAEQSKERTIRRPGREDHEFRRVGFRSRRLPSSILSVYYAWSSGDRWRAPDAPRLTLAHYPKLYKIQVAAYLNHGANSNACESFLEDFLPVVEKYLVD